MMRCRMSPVQVVKTVVVLTVLPVLVLVYTVSDLHTAVGRTRVDDGGGKHVYKIDKRHHELIRDRFNRRLRYLQDRCNGVSDGRTATCHAQDMSANLKHLESNGLVFCTIEKTGSTLFKRILHVAGGWANSTNPLAIRSRDSDTENGGFRTPWNATSDEIDNLFELSKSVMFVRNPFSRLFSAWLDKFYSTNPYYWKSFGRRIIKEQRVFASNLSLTCGSDVTFPEFVRFIVNEITQTDGCVDGHFSSSYNHCLPCNFTYNYIGKFESLKEDIYFLVEELNLTDKVEFADFETAREADIMLDAAEWVFEKRTDIEECMPFGCGLFRVWRRLQIQGILGKKIRFPYKTTKEADAVTIPEFSQAIKDAHMTSDPYERKHNRHAVLLEVYRTVSPSTLKGFLDTFSKDFELFDYSKDPMFLRDTVSDDYTYVEQCPFSFYK